jgi:hypothetical protein
MKWIVLARLRVDLTPPDRCGQTQKISAQFGAQSLPNMSNDSGADHTLGPLLADRRASKTVRADFARRVHMRVRIPVL